MKFYKIIVENEANKCTRCGNKFITITCDTDDIYEIEDCCVCGKRRSAEVTWKLGEWINQRIEDLE